MFFDAAALSAIADLELVSRRIVDGTISGLHRSPFHGYSAEFSQYRHYRPGDDLKYIDWKLFARTDRLFTKQYRETTNLLCTIALDASASMNYASEGGVTKLVYGKLLAASLAHLIARQGDAVGLSIYADGLQRYLPSRGGQAHLRSILLTLNGVTPGGTTDGATALSRVLDLMKRRGLLVVISDLYDENPAVEQALKRAAHIGHEVIMFHVLTPDELRWPFRGDLEVADAENGNTVLTGGSSATIAYRDAISAFLERWRARSATYGLDYVRVPTDAPLDATLRGYLRRRTAGPCA